MFHLNMFRGLNHTCLPLFGNCCMLYKLCQLYLECVWEIHWVYKTLTCWLHRASSRILVRHRGMLILSIHTRCDQETQVEISKWTMNQLYWFFWTGRNIWNIHGHLLLLANFSWDTDIGLLFYLKFTRSFFSFLDPCRILSHT
jgi:hypothetical protein